MIPFHKPRVFRSPTGCCICKTKTSSSRFTDSKKYEGDFVNCFNLIEQRTGQICNACVLLVKRWKKLPDRFDRNWHHVVDARAGPGTKSLTRYKNSKKNKRNSNNINSPIKKKHRYIKKESPDDDPSEILHDDLDTEDNVCEESPIPSPCLSPYPSPYPSPSPQQSEDEVLHYFEKPMLGSGRRKQRNPSQLKLSEFVDLAYWRQEVVCCGTVYLGKQGEVMVDPRFFLPCSCRSAAKADLHDLGNASLARLSCAASDGGSHYGDELSEHNLSDDSLDHRLDDSCYSSAANSPSHEPTSMLLHHHLPSNHNS